MQSMTLSDIQDYDMKDKVRRLRGIAPHLSVRDLYEALIISRGDFEAVRDRVHLHAHRSARKGNLHSPNQSQDNAKTEDEDVKIKIDFDDPAFIFDNDAPTNNPVDPRYHRYQSPEKPKKSKTTQSANTSKKRTAAGRQKQVRPSIVREFLVPDDATVTDWSASYLTSDNSDTTDSASSGSRVSSGNDNGEDLNIDMEKPFLLRADLAKTGLRNGGNMAKPHVLDKWPRAMPLERAQVHSSSWMRVCNRADARKSDQISQ